jgi:hypothetical protein
MVQLVHPRHDLCGEVVDRHESGLSAGTRLAIWNTRPSASSSSCAAVLPAGLNTESAISVPTLARVRMIARSWTISA